MKWRQG